MSKQSQFSRRHFLGGMTFGAVSLGMGDFAERLFGVPGAFADELVRTPAQTEGPFYPDKLPLDTDNDLIIVNEKVTPAVGTITHLTGRILDAKGEPIRGAVVEIWQCDNAGVYLHSADNANRSKQDKNFQGFGRFLTSRTGEYYFRTIKPVPYPGRTPHIHFAVNLKGKRVLTSQCYIKGFAGNTQDMVYMGIRDTKARDSVTIDFDPIKDSKIGEVAAKFDLVLGITPELT